LILSFWRGQNSPVHGIEDELIYNADPFMSTCLTILCQHV